MIPRYRSPLSIGAVMAETARVRKGVRKSPAAGLFPGAVRAWLPSASDGLVRILRARNETGIVILPAYTCIRVVEAVRAAGWLPSYVDIRRESFEVPVEQVVERLRGSSGPVVVLGTHLHGMPQSMGPLRGAAEAAGGLLIEDCAMAQGAVGIDGPVGSSGHASIFSFGLGKVISSGIGGGIVGELPFDEPGPALETHVSDGAALLAWLSRAGIFGDARFFAQEALKSMLKVRNRPRNDGSYIPKAWSARSAATLQNLMSDPKLELALEQRRLRTMQWFEFVRGLASGRVMVPTNDVGARPCCPGLPLVVEDRELLSARLRRVGVHTARYFDYCAASRDGSEERFPNAHWLSERILLLPMDREIDGYAERVQELIAVYASGK